MANAGYGRRIKGKAAKLGSLCGFFQWFWFSIENRTARWPAKVVRVKGLFTFQVKQGGSLKTIMLRGPGCYGYEITRQLWRLLGQGLMNRRWKWFQHWNRHKCFKCLNDTFQRNYIDYIEGTLMEEGVVCKKCQAPAWYYAYGDHEEYWTCEWERIELKLFGNAVKENYSDHARSLEIK